jgi:hypothetical protein
MKAYMGFEKDYFNEIAVLIFAHSVKEAKVLGWNNCDFCDNFINYRVTQIKNQSWIFKEMIKDTPHVIDNPKSCEECMMWGVSEIGADGLCEGCRELNEHTQTTD